MEHDEIERLIRSSRRVIGCVAPDIEPGVGVASWINVSRFVDASGDDNPLYLDVQYGAGSVHHTMLAPPTFVLAVRAPASAGVLDLTEHRLIGTLSSLHLGWDDTVRLGDALAGRVCVSDVSRRLTEAGGARACVLSTVEYQRNGVGFARGWAEVEVAPLDEDHSLFPHRSIHRYEPADVERMVRELDTEEPSRGAVPRLWSDVAVGEATPAMLKGPLTLSDLELWVFAEGRPVRAGNLHHERLAGLKGRRAPSPVTGWPAWDRAETSLDSAVTDPSGPSAPGGLLFTLAGQHVTHWMGDDAFLRQLSVRIIQPFRYGDALRLTGTVIDRYTATDEARTRYHAITLRVAGRNQLGESVVEAHAVVFLPDRGKPVRLPVRGGLACDVPLEN
ncbi:MaoC family dehydratase N-terminal domain-containing protein [Microbispora sp. NEAU-D428]|uniref:FAS1-like dehydratase domain-containing protein n=1 Tax=Microbispora sitophila TaxID=2771537 RepID=UPI001867C9E6|nr:MaoC family dehydratase N-terminal domain-containing protein [Microbispora sitophila]MBE3014106.1 MaoC family dehydratase N-terminal domain-containing protein [Microbispora sitophila]